MTTLNLVAYERIGLANPVSEAVVASLLDLTDLEPGDRAAELGCGNAALALLLAGGGLDVIAVDRGEAMAALAARRVAASSELPGRVQVRQGEAGDIAAQEGPFRLVSVVGATALTDFDALSSWIEPGGWLLWGDIVWRSPPKDGVQPAGMDYDTDEGWRMRAQRAGLELVQARPSNESDWSGYVADLTGAVADWSAENPEHPQRAAIVARAQAMASMYAPANLKTLGFVLYLFRKPC